MPYAVGSRVMHRPGGTCLRVVAGQSPRGRRCWSQWRTMDARGPSLVTLLLDMLWQAKRSRVWPRFSCTLSVPMHAPVHLVEEEAQGVVAAADAFAEGDVAGLGGWWLPPGHDLDLANHWPISSILQSV